MDSADKYFPPISEARTVEEMKEIIQSLAATEALVYRALRMQKLHGFTSEEFYVHLAYEALVMSRNIQREYYRRAEREASPWLSKN